MAIYLGNSPFFRSIGSNLASLGTALGLKEYGVSEALGAAGKFGQKFAPRPVQAAEPTARTPVATTQYSSPIGPTLPAGSVLGTSTGGLPSGGGGGVIPTSGTGEPSGPSPEELYRQQMQGQINAGWDAYTNQLNEMLGTTLPAQQASQQQLAQQTYQTGVGQLGTQKAASERQLEGQQATSLRDLAGNVRNLFQTGNVYLGSRGAGDSSAADQYSYAITQLGTKARADILRQANERRNQISDIYNSEVGRLEQEKNDRVAQIADWFNTNVQNLRTQLAQAGLGRSQDLQALTQTLYNQALSSLQAVQQEQANRRSTLETWAANNATNVSQLIANLSSIGQSMPAFTGLNVGSPQVTASGFTTPVGYGTTTTEKRDIFGNIIG